MPEGYFRHMQDDMNLCILHMFKGTFSLHTAHLYLADELIVDIKSVLVGL